MTAERWHGTPGGYTNHRCKCERCRAAWAKYRRGWKARQSGLPPGDPRHGTESGYGNYGCRCKECSAAFSTARRAREGRAA